MYDISTSSNPFPDKITMIMIIIIIMIIINRNKDTYFGAGYRYSLINGLVDDDDYINDCVHNLIWIGRDRFRLFEYYISLNIT